MSIDPRAFRDAMGCFVTGVTVISTLSPEGDPVGLTANSFNSVSLDPPLVLFSLAKEATRFNAYVQSRHFAVNVLADDQRELSARFARKGETSWDGVHFHTWETGCPIVPGALASFECVTEATYEGGDHLIIVGRVLKVLHVEQGRPLLYWRGRYGAIAPD